MKQRCQPAFNLIAALAALTFAHAASAQRTGPAAFVGDSATYLGCYSLEEKTLSVDIDGIHYRGNYDKTVARSGEKLNDDPASGHWGRAFLFGSSAKVLQCTLDSGFPNLSGSCTSAEGRRFRIEARSPL